VALALTVISTLTLALTLAVALALALALTLALTPHPWQVLRETDALAEILEVTLDRTLSLMMLDWTKHKDITRIAQWIDPALLGGFVKAVMRVSSYIDVLKEVLLGLGMYEVHNKLDNHMDLLLGGLVTNESLYLRIADE